MHACLHTYSYCKLAYTKDREVLQSHLLLQNSDSFRHGGYTSLDFLHHLPQLSRLLLFLPLQRLHPGFLLQTKEVVEFFKLFMCPSFHKLSLTLKENILSLQRHKYFRRFFTFSHYNHKLQCNLGLLCSFGFFGFQKNLKYLFNSS